MHAMETNVGAGAGQAIEDAYILARLLTSESVSRATIPAALFAYNEARLSFTMDVVRRTHYAGRLFEFNEGPTPYESSDNAWQNGWGAEVSQVWDFQLQTGGAEECWKKAEVHLRDALSSTETDSD